MEKFIEKYDDIQNVIHNYYLQKFTKHQKNIFLAIFLFCSAPLIFCLIPLVLVAIAFLAPFTIGVYLFLYALIHLLILVYPQITNYAVFMNLVYWPFYKLDKPSLFGLNKVHNFYLKTDPENAIKCGVWHFIPDSIDYDHKTDSHIDIDDHFEKYFKIDDGRPIIIYVHGQDADRARVNRRNLCLNLSKLDYHVFAIDYRGYGDSSGWPTEEGVVKDVLELFNFIKMKCSLNSQLYIWGHSLGTGISSHAAKILSETNNSPSGLILEAPFLNISKASKEYILAPLVLNNPWIKDKFDIALEKLNIRLSNDKNILKINSKILIIHAADDWFIPQRHSYDLMKIVKECRPMEYPPVELIEYAKDLRLGHNEIYRNPELYPAIKKSSMANQGIYLAKLNLLRENLYKNNQNRPKHGGLDSYISNRQSKLFNEIINFDRVSSDHLEKNLNENEKEFDGKIIQTQLMKPQRTLKVIKKNADSEMSSDTMSMNSSTSESKSYTTSSPTKCVKKLEHLGGGFNNSATKSPTNNIRVLPPPKFIAHLNRSRKKFDTSIDGLKLQEDRKKYIYRKDAFNSQSIISSSKFSENQINNAMIATFKTGSNFNLPKVINASSPTITSLNEIIHNQNAKPLTLNDNSIRRLKKLLNLDDFSIIKEKEEAKNQSKTEKNMSHKKSSHKRTSLATVSGYAFPTSHRTDYTQIVSKVMILKKLSNKSKSGSLQSKSINSFESESRESFNSYLDSSRNDVSNIMKIVITEKVPMPPRSSPRTDEDENDS